MVPALITAAVVATMSLLVSPYTTLRVQTMLHDARNTTGLELLSPGRFRIINQGQGRVTYVDQMNQDTGEMFGVFAADRLAGLDGTNRQVLIVADRGHLDVDPDTGERFLVLQQGTRYLGQPGDLAYQVMDFAKLGQRMEQPPTSPLYRKQDMLTTAELLRSDKVDSRATLQWRISLALLVLVSTLMAMAMARTDHRRGRYGKLFPAFLLFMVYLVLLNAAREAVNKQQIPADLGLWWIHGLFLLIGLGLLFGGDLWRARRARLRQAKAGERA
jgi:lipopolysaccharide export system permease protein